MYNYRNIKSTLACLTSENCYKVNGKSQTTGK